MKLFVCLSLFIGSLAQASVDEDVDYVAVASVLVKDGYVNRAESTLKKLNLKEDDIDFAKYWFVKGIIELSRKNYEASIEILKKALNEKGDDKSEIHLYIAEALFNLKRYDQALSHINQCQLKTLAFFILKSSVLWALKDKEKSWQTLNQAILVTKDQRTIYKKQFSLLVEETLYFSAQEFVTKRISNFNETDIVAIASVFRDKGRFEEAIKVLEVARLKWPYDERVNMELAYNYIKLQKKLSATLIVEELSRVHNHLSNDASELLRASHLTYRVAFLEMHAEDPKQSLKHKLAIYLESEKFDLVAQMAPLLRDNNLLEQEDIRYALAYAYFKVGKFNKSNAHLGRLTRDDLFEKANELREEMQKCKQNRWLCNVFL